MVLDIEATIGVVAWLITLKGSLAEQLTKFWANSAFFEETAALFLFYLVLN